MDKTTRQLLNLLSAAMGTKKGDMVDLQEADWNKLFSLAHIHNIIPMIYELAQTNQFYSPTPPELSNVWRKLAISSSVNQMHRTMEFLQVYDKLNQAGIPALVVKGAICRELYPNHYYRSSGDEDVYIQKTNFQRTDSIFQAFCLLRDKSKNRGPALEQVTTYRSPKHGLTIELHVDLFRPESELFGPMNRLFGNVFEDSITILVDGITVHTLSHDKHLLFLILHSIKHFLAIGFGIRQVCDLVMYSNAYGQEVDWNWLWSKVTALGYEVFLLNLLDIGARYLGLDQDKICYPKGWSSADIHSDALLEDIMEAGIFGKNTPERAKSGFMTLCAASDDRKPPGTHHSSPTVLRALFPGSRYMGSHYSYCSKYQILLPVAWFHRIALYVAKARPTGTIFGMAGRSITIGKKRIELLKEYRIIGGQEESSTKRESVGRLE